MRPVIEATVHPRVQAALTEAGVSYVVHRHADCPFPVRSPADFARCLGRPLGAITKTLLLEVATAEAPAGLGLAVCPAALRVNFAVLARRWNAVLVRLAGRDLVEVKLGYPPNGVSPLGCGHHPVAIDEATFAHETVLIGAGVTGVKIEIAPADLQRICGAGRLAFTHS